jgi:hypothetical protein
MIYYQFRIPIYQQVTVVNLKQPKNQLVHMIVRNFLIFSLNKAKMKKIGITINLMSPAIKKKEKLGNHQPLPNQHKISMMIS